MAILSKKIMQQWSLHTQSELPQWHEKNKGPKLNANKIVS